MKLVSSYLALCFLSSLFLLPLHTKAQDNKKLTKQMIGTWLIQTMSYRLNKNVTDEALKKEWEAQKTMMSAEMKNRFAFVFEKGGKFKSILSEGDKPKEVTGTWRIEGSKLRVKTTDKAMESEFENVTVGFNKKVLEMAIGAPENMNGSNLMVLGFEKGDLKNLNHSASSTRKPLEVRAEERVEEPILVEHGVKSTEKQIGAREPELTKPVSTVEIKDIEVKGCEKGKDDNPACYLIQITPKDSWMPFPIEGFVYEAGYDYKLKVEIATEIGSNPTYKLIEIVSKKKNDGKD